MFYLIHTTSSINAYNILNDGVIRSAHALNKLNNVKIDNNDKYAWQDDLPYVYTMLVTEENIKKYCNSLGISRIGFIFDTSLLLTRTFTLNLSHYIYPDGETYDGKKLSERELTAILEKYYNKILEIKRGLKKYASDKDMGLYNGEIIFKNQISIKPYLIKLYYGIGKYYTKKKEKNWSQENRVFNIINRKYKNVDIILYNYKKNGNYKI